MKKALKLIFIFAIIAILALSLVACGNDKNNDNPEDLTPGTEENTGNTPETDPETPPEEEIDSSLKFAANATLQDIISMLESGEIQTVTIIGGDLELEYMTVGFMDGKGFLSYDMSSEEDIVDPVMAVIDFAESKMYDIFRYEEEILGYKNDIDLTELNDIDTMYEFAQTEYGFGFTVADDMTVEISEDGLTATVSNSSQKFLFSKMPFEIPEMFKDYMTICQEEDYDEELTFDEGTTAEDIIAMVERGEIKNFTVESSDGILRAASTDKYDIYTDEMTEGFYIHICDWVEQRYIMIAYLPSEGFSMMYQEAPLSEITDSEIVDIIQFYSKGRMLASDLSGEIYSCEIEKREIICTEKEPETGKSAEVLRYYDINRTDAISLPEVMGETLPYELEFDETGFHMYYTDNSGTKTEMEATEYTF